MTEKHGRNAMNGREEPREVQRLWDAAPNWPTQRGSDQFWEELGRTVATFGMLEDTLTRSYFIVSGHRRVEENENPQVLLDTWYDVLVATLSDPLGTLTKKLNREWKRQNGDQADEKRRIILELKALGRERNKVCHGAWIGFEENDTGTIRFFAKGREREGNHRQRLSIDDIRAVRNRARNCIGDLMQVLRVEYGAEFPGMP